MRDVGLFVSILLLIHLIVCAIVFLLIKGDFLRVSMQLFPLVLFHPVWGVIMVVKADRYLKHKKTGTREFHLDRLGLGESDYRIVAMSDDVNEQSVVPLEEAFVVNDQETRRKLMIDVLQRDPEHYIQLLQKARENEDIEVTHYATTAIMEIQRDFELQIKRTEEAFHEAPDEQKAVEEHLFAIRDYIKSGLMQDSLLYMQRQRLDHVITKRLEMPDLTPELYLEAIDNLLEMDVLEKPRKILDEALHKWPKNEDLWMMRIKYFHLFGDGSMIKQTIADIRRSRLYLSPAAQQKIAFWNR